MVRVCVWLQGQCLGGLVFLTPKLSQVVLQRGPRQQQSKLEVHFATHLCQLSFHVFDDVAFVQNKTTPVDLVHERVLHRWVLEHLVGRHDLPGWW